MISIPELYSLFLQYPTVTTDTRNIKQGDIFFALKGPNFDGNKFALQALEAGASYVVVDDATFATDSRILLTQDVLTTLQDLARHHRKQFNIPVIGITGSNGKTTTKELVNAVLSTTYITYTTQGNLNNHIGVPLTLLRIKPDAEMVVIEMGANHLGEISAYCTYALPNFGLITNCGKAHLEGFGSIEGVRKGKGELFDYLRSANGLAFICSNFDYFIEMGKDIEHKIWYGTLEGDVTGVMLESNPFLHLQMNNGWQNTNNSVLQTELVGGYNIYNVLAAVAIGIYFKIPSEKIKHAIESYSPSNSRSQLIEKNGNKIVLDAYNANPASMLAAIENFGNITAENKVLLLGGMMELGESSLQEHEMLIELIKKYNWKNVILVGGDFSKILHPYHYFDNSVLAAEWMKDHIGTGNYLLIKGSRGMKMERIIAD